jgi:RNA polymerase sigma-70 factor (ECF subfamily)
MAADIEINAGEGSTLPDPDYDSFLVAQAKAGEPEVWQHWFDQYYHRLYSYAFLRTRRKADAEDIVAQVMFEAVKGIKRYEYQGRPIIAWLFGIAHHLIADSIKGQLRRDSIEGAAGGNPTRAADPQNRIENIDLLRALDDLTDEQRDVIILRYFMDMRPREIGEVLGKTEVAVYSLQARAILALRGSMKDVSL